MEIKVSIVVAIYNIENLIIRCIESLCNQTLKELEIILVDDCSTDRSADICDRYRDQYPQITVIHKKINEGLSEARNTGLKLAKGKYVSFVDGDDYIDLDTCEKLFYKAECYKSDILVFGYYNDNVKGNIIEHKKNTNNNLYTNEKILNELFPRVIGTLPKEKSDYDIGFAPWANFYNTDFLKKNNLNFISERKLIYEDLMFALDSYACAKRVGIYEEAFYHYCENKSSLTLKPNPNKYNRIKDMYDFLKTTPKYYNQLFKEKEIVFRLKRTMLSYVRLCIIQNTDNLKNIKSIKTISSDSFCEEILKDYPIALLPIKHRVFAYFLYKKHNFCLFVICKLNRII